MRSRVHTMRPVRNTTFYWLSIPDGALQGAATPWGMLRTARGVGKAGSEARAGVVELYRGDVYRIGRALSHSAELAKDIAQDFAAMFLQEEIYTQLDERKGGFRKFLTEWVRTRVLRAWERRARRHENPIEEAKAIEDKGRKSPEETVDLILTVTRVTEVRKRTQAALVGEPLAWEAFERWHFQEEASDGTTQRDLAVRLGVSHDRLEGLIRRARDQFRLEFLHLVSQEVGDHEQMAEELGMTRALLEKELARYWRQARRRGSRRPPSAF